MRTHFDKLIRDRIPEIIDASGGRCAVEELDDAAYRRALLQKLVEEAQEAASSDTSDALLLELADVREVIDAVVTAFALSEEQVVAEQQRRRAERGAFARRIRLLWTEDPAT